MPAPDTTGWVMDRARIPLLAKSMKDRTTLFHGGADPWAARSWLKNLEGTFWYMKCTDEEKVELAAYHLRDQAVTWWDMQKSIFGEQRITWQMYREAFERQYFPVTFCLARRQEFLNLKQGDRSVMEYNAEFSRLAEFCPHLVAQDYDRMHQFTQGLAAYIRLKMSGFPGSSYREVLDRVLFIEMTQQQVNLEKSNNKQVTQKKEKRGQSSQITSGGSSPPRKTRRTSDGGSRSSQRDRKNDFGGIMCFQCGSKSHTRNDCPLDHAICFYYKLLGHESRNCTLKAQLEMTKEATQGGRPTQPRQQKGPQRTQNASYQSQLPGPQGKVYHIQSQEYPVMPATTQYSTAASPYQTYPVQQDPALPSQPYSTFQPQTQPQYPQQQQDDAPPNPRQPTLRMPPSSAEVGRGYAVTREEAQRAEGLDFQGISHFIPLV
ncbi:uncharacterized protein LOC122051540 [Zingiber officinale]|uniref:uncharacterized protein LOC122051540 n=1 Tax=Zingiber officinale TaxID=94328 RepID=UPI001C4CA935|nr:uncharacterized protein LOC122051540 [Zingiber officinale]